jgi:CrcB protein
MSLAACAIVLLGGFCGGVMRFFVSGVVGRAIGETFPWGTLVVNVSGALLIGALAGLGRAAGGVFAGDLFRDFLVVGICGGYTTVSSFCLQTLNLGLDGESGRAVANIVLSTALCVAGVAAGFFGATGLVG